jgi:O-antigen/teichoic acid export membrane protein
MSENSNVKRVLKNTLALYFRMIVLTFISLFTVRVVFQVLGASDYGLYNVVGGFVGMFGFLTGTLTIAEQRYFAISLSSRDWDSLSKLFSVNLVVNAIFGMILFLISETIGLWFVSTQLVIPVERMTAAFVVYELSIVSFLLALIVAPYMALLVADENLSIYSVVSIFEGISKLLIVYLLLTSNSDKLITYAVLLCLISISVNVFYVIYCKVQYPALQLKVYRDKNSYKEVLSFMNWNLIGAIASVLKGQGINMVMNVFFGPVINAARGIAFQINNVIMSFSQNFMKAIDPQIIKSYAKGEQERFFFLITASSKISYYLLFFIALPFMLNINYVLNLWLVEPPQYTSIFTILILVDALVASITDPICTAVQAVGEVKVYQLTVGVIAILNLPIAYSLLVIYNDPLVPFIVSIVISVVMALSRLVTFRRLYDFSIMNYCCQVFFPICLVTLLMVCVDGYLFSQADNFPHFIGNSIGTMVFSASIIYRIGLNAREKNIIKNALPGKNLINKFRR